MVLDYLKTGEAYQIEIIREKGRYYIHVSIEESTPIAYAVRNGAVGVDTNPDGLGIACADYQGQFKKSFWQPLCECTYARSKRRENLIGEAAAKIVDMSQKLNCLLVVEDLAFKDDKSITAKFNRMSHGFIWSKFLEMTERRALRKGVPLVKVKPAFTSIIGILKYQSQYGLSNHEAAGYVIARRGLGCENERVPKPLIKLLVRKKDGFFKLNNWKQWSAIKKSVISKLKKHNKKEVKSLVSWQHYRKQLLVSG